MVRLIRRDGIGPRADSGALDSCAGESVVFARQARSTTGSFDFVYLRFAPFP